MGPIIKDRSQVKCKQGGSAFGRYLILMENLLEGNLGPFHTKLKAQPNLHLHLTEDPPSTM